MKYSNVQIIDSDNNKHKKYAWIIAMTFFMAGAGLMAFISTLGEYAVYAYYMIIPVLAGIVAAIIACALNEHFRWSFLILIIPMLITFIPAGIMGGINGARIWIDVIIQNWNTIHKDGIALLSVTGGQSDILAFSLLAAIIIGELSFWFMNSCAIVKSMLYIVFWIVLQLIAGNINLLSCGILIAVALIMNIAGKSFYITARSIIVSGIILILSILMVVTGNKEITAVRTMRGNISDEVDDIRYGKDSLVEGNIKNAAELLSASEDMLTVKTEQEKNIYLRGYVGSEYDKAESKWKEFSNSHYGGDNYGMLEWLYKNDFNPLTQSAQYYELTDKSEKQPVNRISINVKNATRRYVYVPSGTSSFLRGNMKYNKDAGYKSKRVSGSRAYEVTEISSQRPSELIIAEEWLTNPQTEAQQKYVNAEAVYRNFVYENYTEETQDYYTLMNQLFWENYSSENDGIYEAVSRVREVLKERITYNEYPKEVPEDSDNTDALMWYITEGKEGNSVIYSSIAVQALRSHGIPARYVEGYYISSDNIKKSKENGIILTGNNSHAWVEIYFDGIGWQPVDVTPGYYYETAALQKLVDIPDDIHKTMAFDNDGNSETGKVVKDESGNSHKAKDFVYKMFNRENIILGIFAVIIIIIVVILSVIEIVYSVVYTHQLKIYKSSASSVRVKIIEKRLYQLLAIRGIDATLGWHTREVDTIMAQAFNAVEEGEYIRACEIMEKVIYGECELEPYELRTLEIFAYKVFTENNKEKGISRFRIKQIAFNKRFT